LEIGLSGSSERLMMRRGLEVGGILPGCFWHRRSKSRRVPAAALAPRLL